eukprot:3813004-Prymnesium_polylepis.1
MRAAVKTREVSSILPPGVVVLHRQYVCQSSERGGPDLAGPPSMIDPPCDNVGWEVEARRSA